MCLIFIFFFKFFPTKYKEFFGRIIELLPTIEPDHILKIIWDFFIISILLILLLSYPLQISFGIDYIFLEELLPLKSLIGIGYEIFFMFFFGMNTVIKLLTAYYEKGILIKEKNKIIFHYFETNFLNDFIAYIPVILQCYFGLSSENEGIHGILRFSLFFIFVKFVEVINFLLSL